MTIKINPKYESLKEFINHLPTTFAIDGEVVYEARNQLRKFSVQGYEVIVKRYKIPHIINRIAYTYLRAPKAVRAYEYAQKLLSMNIQSPEPIAYIITQKGGLIAYSYFISIYESTYKDIRSVMEGSETDENLIQSLGKYTASLHNQGVLHHDLSPGNVLYTKQANEYQFSLIDINRMEFTTNISFKKRCKSFNRLSFNKDVLKRVAAAYAEGAGFDKIRTVEEITKYSDNYFNSYRVRSRK